jgi:ketosteroid isomerase-like protein
MAENVTTIATIYEAFGRGDVPRILDLLADDVEWESWADNRAQRGGVPWLAAKRGKAGAAEFFQCVATHMQVRDFQVLSLMAGGNQVAAEIVIEADITASGRRYRDEELHLWTFDGGGKVTRFRHYVDTAKHLEAASLKA